MGARKQKAFYLTTALLFIAFVAVLALGEGIHAAEIFETYTIAQTIVVAGFYGGNSVEHWSKAKGGGNV